MNVRSAHWLLLALLAFAPFAGCGTPEEPAKEAENEDETAAECPYPKSQQASQPCCPEHGIDACGALLVCGALDGRTQPTCYPERSRADMTECSHDLLCVSGSCNLEKRRCFSDYFNPCDPEIGCKQREGDSEFVCATPPESGWDTPVCHRQNLRLGAQCDYSYECSSRFCLEGRCAW